MTTRELEAVRKSVLVRARVEKAFEVFTDGITSWWPLEQYSIGGEKAETVVLEGRTGGELYETLADGSRAHWATVLAWEPPHRLVLEWKVNPDTPAPTEIEVRFAAEGERTRVDLEHRGWERLGDAAEEGRASYDEGWDFVLGERYSGAFDA